MLKAKSGWALFPIKKRRLIKMLFHFQNDSLRCLIQLNAHLVEHLSQTLLLDQDLIQIIAWFKKYSVAGVTPKAEEALLLFFEEFILVEKKILNKNIDPTTDLQGMKQLYAVAQDCLLYIKFKLQLTLSTETLKLLRKVSSSLLQAVCHPEANTVLS